MNSPYQLHKNWNNFETVPKTITKKIILDLIIYILVPKQASKQSVLPENQHNEPSTSNNPGPDDLAVPEEPGEIFPPLTSAVNNSSELLTSAINFSSEKKKKKKTKTGRDMALDDNCVDLRLTDLVPNKAGVSVTLEEVLDKTKHSEGFVEDIIDHRMDENGDCNYFVKWIAYKDTTWEFAGSISGDIVTRNWANQKRK